MRDLVRDQTRHSQREFRKSCSCRAVAVAAEQVAGEDDRARILHAAKTRRADYQRELLVRIRSDRFCVKNSSDGSAGRNLSAPAALRHAARNTKAA